MRQGGGCHDATPGAEGELLPLPVQGADAYQAEEVSVIQKPERSAETKRTAQA